jgi:hypothetical protein
MSFLVPVAGFEGIKPSSTALVRMPLRQAFIFRMVPLADPFPVIE